jgi:hypothetical protein
MNSNIKKIKLTEKDKKTISSNSSICTDFDSGNCDKLKNSSNKKLN